MYDEAERTENETKPAEKDGKSASSNGKVRNLPQLCIILSVRTKKYFGVWIY